MLLIVITPLLVDSIFFSTWPEEFIIAEIPLLDDRKITLPSSMDLNIECEKC